MTDLFLTDDELVHLTECKRASDQIRVLEDNHIPFTRTRNNAPRVARAWFEGMHKPSGGYAEEPNWAAIGG